MEIVYDYLHGQEFCNRVSGIVEAFKAMHKDLEDEKATSSDAGPNVPSKLSECSSTLLAFTATSKALSAARCRKSGA
jgi:hypothetical protein